MKKVYFILSILLSLGLNAKTIDFKFTTSGYTYDFLSSTNKIELNGDQIELTLLKKECNKLILVSFHEILKKKINKMVINKQDYYRLVLNDKTYKLDKKSELALFLENLPSMTKTLKRKESYQCH